MHVNATDIEQALIELRDPALRLLPVLLLWQSAHDAKRATGYPRRSQPDTPQCTDIVNPIRCSRARSSFAVSSRDPSSLSSTSRSSRRAPSSRPPSPNSPATAASCEPGSSSRSLPAGTELRRADRYRAPRRRRPQEPAALKPLGVERDPQTVMPEDFTRSPRRPRKIYRSPACGSCPRSSWTWRARVFMPRRMSVTPVASQTRTPPGTDGVDAPSRRHRLVPRWRCHEHQHAGGGIYAPR